MANVDIGQPCEGAFCALTLGNKRLNDNNEVTAASLCLVSVSAGAARANTAPMHPLTSLAVTPPAAVSQGHCTRGQLGVRGAWRARGLACLRPPAKPWLGFVPVTSQAATSPPRVHESNTTLAAGEPCDSPVGILGNLVFPNLFSFSGIQSLLCFQGSQT